MLKIECYFANRIKKKNIYIFVSLFEQRYSSRMQLEGTRKNSPTNETHMLQDNNTVHFDFQLNELYKIAEQPD